MCYRELNPPECKSRDAMLVNQSKSLYSFLVMMDGYNLCNIKKGPMCLTLNFTVSELCNKIVMYILLLQHLFVRK